MVERVGFARKMVLNMDEFYLPEDVVEWLGLKKSEYLSKLIEHSAPDDFGFHEFLDFEEFTPLTLGNPDWTHDYTEDGYRLKAFVRTYAERGVFLQVVIGALIPDQNEHDVFVPFMSFVTKKDEVVKLFIPMNQKPRH